MFQPMPENNRLIASIFQGQLSMHLHIISRQIIFHRFVLFFSYIGDI